MTAIQTIGRLSIDGPNPALLERLEDSHRRVRAATALALERVGEGEAVEGLSLAVASSERSCTERFAAERAIARILERDVPDC